MTAEKIKFLEDSINEAIAELTKGGGFLYVVDRRQNDFAIKLTEPIHLTFFEGYKGE